MATALMRFVGLGDQEDGPAAKRPRTVQNHAGGECFAVDDITRLRRFLLLGVEGGTYYTSEQKMCAESVESLKRLIDAGLGIDAVALIQQISVEGRAAKQDPTLFALAFCARSGEELTRIAAYKAVEEVCRIPTHLFTFISYCEVLSGNGTGWGRAHRRAVGSWYSGKTGLALARAVTKYPSRNGWSHRDVLRLSHVNPGEKGDSVKAVLLYAARGWEAVAAAYNVEAEISSEAAKSSGLASVLSFLRAAECAKRDPSAETEVAADALAAHVREVVSLICDQGLVREHINTRLLDQKEVWRALLDKMPLTALIRNLPKLTLVGLLERGSPALAHVCALLKSRARLEKARIHPFNVLLALRTYAQGKGVKGKLRWDPVPALIDALDEAFYLAFRSVVPTGRRYLLALDVSGSMCCPIGGGSSVLSCRESSAAMAMVTVGTEESVRVVAFTSKITPLNLSRRQRLDDVVKTISNMPFGATDCAQPMIYAKDKGLQVDTFVVYTDNETWFGNVRPDEALRAYRKASGIADAKLAVVAMAGHKFSIADPDDAGMLDMVGFDSAAPEILREFSLGNL